MSVNRRRKRYKKRATQLLLFSGRKYGKLYHKTSFHDVTPVFNRSFKRPALQWWSIILVAISNRKLAITTLIIFLQIGKNPWSLTFRCCASYISFKKVCRSLVVGNTWTSRLALVWRWTKCSKAVKISLFRLSFLKISDEVHTSRVSRMNELNQSINLVCAHTVLLHSTLPIHQR